MTMCRRDGNPLDRRAPEEDWDALYDFLRTAGKPRAVSELEDDHVQRAAINLEIVSMVPAPDASFPGLNAEPPRGVFLAECA